MAEIFDRSLKVGLNNFLFVETEDSDITYDYTSYMSQQGSILILRVDKAGKAGKYYLTKGVYTTVWAARATYDYVYPNELVDQVFIE